MVQLDVTHARLIPFAVALAEAIGSTETLIQPRLPGLEPDVLGIRDTNLLGNRHSNWRDVAEPQQGAIKPLVIVQVETSTGAKLGSKNARNTLATHAKAAPYADFFYILDGPRYTRANITQLLEMIPKATVYSEDEMYARFGKPSLKAVLQQL